MELSNTSILSKELQSKLWKDTKRAQEQIPIRNTIYYSGLMLAPWSNLVAAKAMWGLFIMIAFEGDVLIINIIITTINTITYHDCLRRWRLIHQLFITTTNTITIAVNIFTGNNCYILSASLSLASLSVDKVGSHAIFFISLNFPTCG